MIIFTCIRHQKGGVGAKYSKNRYARIGSETKINITSVTRVM